MAEIPNSCPRCGKPLEVRKGTYGTYLDCTDYPKCKYTAELSSKNVPKTKQNDTSSLTSCPKCGKKLALYIGKYGIFLGCFGYPNCNYSHNFEDPYNIPCPECGKIMKERTGTYGRFYGCKGYPKCKFTYNLRVKGKTEEKKQPKKLVLPEDYGSNDTDDDKFTYNLRVKRKNSEKKRSKMLELPEGFGFKVTGDDILGALSREGQNLRELANKLKLTDKVDINYLKLKLKEFEIKGFIVQNLNENSPTWKKT